MAKILVGGIYYFRAYQTFDKEYKFKSYVYIGNIDLLPVFIKINSKPSPSRQHIELEKITYSDVDCLMKPISFLDFGRLEKGLLSKNGIWELEAEAYRGCLVLGDLLLLIEGIDSSKTLSRNEKVIILESLRARLAELQ